MINMSREVSLLLYFTFAVGSADIIVNLSASKVVHRTTGSPGHISYMISVSTVLVVSLLLYFTNIVI